MTESFDRVLTTLRGMSPEVRAERVAGSPLHNRFLDAFPKDSIATLTLDQYCVGGSSKKSSFSWWIERGLQPVLGRYMPGTSRGHLLYWQDDGTLYKHRHLRELPDEEALQYTCEIHQVVVNAAQDADVAWIDNDELIYQRAGVSEKRTTMSGGRKLRLLSVYNPDAFVPVYSPDHLRHFLRQFGVDESDLPEKSRTVALSEALHRFFELAKESFGDLTPKAFMSSLYASSSAVKPPRRKESGKHTSAEEEDDVDDENEAQDTERPAKKDRSLDLNVILYGPPGTGKTYTAVEEAVRILDPKLLELHRLDPNSSEAERRARREVLKSRYDELRRDKRVEFVTFHQSFSYEDFVEGIRPEPRDDKLIYRVEDGVFKRLCVDAAARLDRADDKPFDLGERRVWKMSLGNTLEDERHIYEDCLRGDYVLLGYGAQIDFSSSKTRDEVRARYESEPNGAPATDFAVQMVHRFKNDLKTDDVVVISDGNRLVRAIGVVEGDYEFAPRSDEVGFAQKRKVRWLRSYAPSLPASEVIDGTFSQQTLYSLNPPILNREKLSGLLRSDAPIAVAQVLREGQLLTGTEYLVMKASREIVTVKKPNGSDISFSWPLLLKLAQHVKADEISVQDIQEKRVFERLPKSLLEKHIVNGYNNILWRIVQPIASALQAPTAVPEQSPRVMIIDEINRGNISKIFGELISLIEPSKRAGEDDELSVTLPYSKTEFAVPSNVYIVGTMNSADRSLTGIDVALRRRFRFKEMMPDEQVLRELEVSSINVGELLRTINQRIELLLGRDFCLGHAYFCPLLELEDPSLRDLAEVFQYQILPLLEEHFFEDWERIGWVLNDHEAPPAVERFLVRPPLRADQLLGANVASGVRDSRWQLNPRALLAAESYMNIIGGTVQ